jgi:outer membrane protein OmpA-like peptidoglycan-associated protein
MNRKFIPIACVILSVAASMIPSHRALAQEIGSLYYYDVPRSEYYDEQKGEYKPEYYQWKIFLEYNLHRKQCQHYQDPPAGYVMKGCQPVRMEQPVAAAPPVLAPAITTPEPEKKPYPPITIYFDFDKSNVRESEKGKISQIVEEIKENKSLHVVIAGHTDTAGSFAYNMKLSKRRAKVIADLLIGSGISKEIIQQKAYGKTDLAVPTADNVPLEANRRSITVFLQ